MKTITSTLTLTLVTALLAGCILTDDKDSNGNDETVTVVETIQDTLRYLTIGEPESEGYDTLGIGIEVMSGFGGLDSTSGTWISGGYADPELVSFRVIYWLGIGQQPAGVPPDTSVTYPDVPCVFHVFGNASLQVADSSVTASIVFTESEIRDGTRLMPVDEEASRPEGLDSVNFAGRPFNGTLSITCPLP